MRCPYCVKFVSLEIQNEPEVDVDVTFDKDLQQLTFEGTVRVVRNCAECCNELKEALFEFYEILDVTECQGYEEIDSSEMTEEEFEVAEEERNANLSDTPDFDVEVEAIELPGSREEREKIWSLYFGEATQIGYELKVFVPEIYEAVFHHRKTMKASWMEPLV